MSEPSDDGSLARCPVISRLTGAAASLPVLVFVPVPATRSFGLTNIVRRFSSFDVSPAGGRLQVPGLSIGSWCGSHPPTNRASKGKSGQGGRGQGGRAQGGGQRSLPLPYAGEDGAKRQVRGSTAHPSSCHHKPTNRRHDPHKARAKPPAQPHFSMNPASSGALPDEGANCRPSKIRSRSVAGRNPSVGARNA